VYGLLRNAIASTIETANIQIYIHTIEIENNKYVTSLTFFNIIFYNHSIFSMFNVILPDVSVVSDIGLEVSNLKKNQHTFVTLFLFFRLNLKMSKLQF